MTHSFHGAHYLERPITIVLEQLSGNSEGPHGFYIACCSLKRILRESERSSLYVGHIAPMNPFQGGHTKSYNMYVAPLSPNTGACVYIDFPAASWLVENTARMFNIARIPELHCDTLSKPPPPSSRSARSIHLMIHDWCYSVVVYHPPPSSDPHSRSTLLTPGEIETRLRAVVLDVEARLTNGEKPLPVGVLSADDRDKWAQVSLCQ